MVLYQLDPTRILTVFVAQGLVFAFFLFLAIKTLKRDTKRLNIIFSAFYVFAIFGSFVNFVYVFLTDVSTILILNFITNFCIFYAPIFLFVFNLILLKSEMVITTSKQLIIFFVYGIAMFGMIIFYFTPIPGVTLNPNFSPVWSIQFFIYLLIVETILILPLLYLSFQIYRKFEDINLKKKWKFFILGFCALSLFMYGIFVSNTLDVPTFRTIISAIGVILGLAGGYLMYYGVGRQIEK
ncbi:MAG: hypothetical protein ACFFFB_00470 [Candidatus Heimdallarchaeota archaeon]